MTLLDVSLIAAALAVAFCHVLMWPLSAGPW